MRWNPPATVRKGSSSGRSTSSARDPAVNSQPTRRSSPRLRAADDYVGNQSRVERSSTDANIPLAAGIDAISIGAGGTGGGAHSLQEWYEPTGREMGLKRALHYFDRCFRPRGGKNKMNQETSPAPSPESSAQPYSKSRPALVGAGSSPCGQPSHVLSATCFFCVFLSRSPSLRLQSVARPKPRRLATHHDLSPRSHLHQRPRASLGLRHGRARRENRLHRRHRANHARVRHQ